MEKIPIIRLENYLLVSIQVEMYDRLAIKLQDDLSEAICKFNSRGVLIDVSSLEILDSFMARILATVASISKLLNTETVIVGIQPTVAITLVELGIDLQGIKTALNIDKGMDLLRRSNAN